MNRKAIIQMGEQYACILFLKLVDAIQLSNG